MKIELFIIIDPYMEIELKNRKRRLENLGVSIKEEIGHAFIGVIEEENVKTLNENTFVLETLVL